MQGRSLLLLLGLLTAGAALAADDPDPTKQFAAEEEAKRLEGTWEVVYYEYGGEGWPELIGLRVVIARGLIHVGDDSIGRAYRVDPRKNPRWIDATGIRDGLCGIYQYEGDRLSLVLRPVRSDIPRPTALRSTERLPDTFMTLRRMKTAGR